MKIMLKFQNILVSFFLFGDENPIKNNLIDVEKLPLFVTDVTKEFHILGKETLGFYKNFHTLNKD